MANEDEIEAWQREIDYVERDTAVGDPHYQLLQMAGQMVAALREAREDTKRFDARMDGMRQAVAFFRSVILSGEEWSSTCESVYQAATSGAAMKPPGGEG